MRPVCIRWLKLDSGQLSVLQMSIDKLDLFTCTHFFFFIFFTSSSSFSIMYIRHCKDDSVLKKLSHGRIVLSKAIWTKGHRITMNVEHRVSRLFPYKDTVWSCVRTRGLWSTETNGKHCHCFTRRSSAAVGWSWAIYFTDTSTCIFWQSWL